MNKTLEHAIAVIARLPEGEQETIACLMLEGIEAERGWEERFSGSGQKLAELARQARAERANGETTEMSFPPEQ
jgi:hypothetical protein